MASAAQDVWAGGEIRRRRIVSLEMIASMVRKRGFGSGERRTSGAKQAAEKGFFTLVLGSGEAHFLVLSLFGIGIAVFVLPPRAV